MMHDVALSIADTSCLPIAAEIDKELSGQNTTVDNLT